MGSSHLRISVHSSTLTPVSSRTSRRVASAGVSPGNTFPPGAFTFPACHAGRVFRTSTTRPRSGVKSSASTYVK